MGINKKLYKIYSNFHKNIRSHEKYIHDIDKFSKSNLCPICGKLAASSSHPCCYCIGKEYNFIQNHVLFQFCVEIEKIFRNFKFRKDKDALEFFCEKLKSHLNANYDKEIILCIVPSNPLSISKKGFDHAKLIRKFLQNNTDYNVINPFVRKKGKAQKQLNLAEREETIAKQIFLNDKLNKEEICFDKNVVLIDDIFTTGNSLNYCSLLLKQLGFSNIFTITFTAKLSGVL